jgi:hypothetical protein
MAAQVDIVLNAIDKTQNGIKSAAQGIKSFGATLGLAAGIFYAANAALDGLQKRLEDLDMKSTAAGIEDAQRAWESLADTVLLSVVDSDWFSGVIAGLEEAGKAAQAFFFFMRAGFEITKKNLGLQSDSQMWQSLGNLAIKQGEALQRSKNAQLKKENEELEKQAKIYNDLGEQMDAALMKGDPRAIKKTREAIEELMRKNPGMSRDQAMNTPKTNSDPNNEFWDRYYRGELTNQFGGKSPNITIVGGGMKDVVTQIIVDGVVAYESAGGRASPNN